MARIAVCERRFAMNPGPTPPGGMNLYEQFAPGVGLGRQCPHCRGVSQVVPNAELQFVCSICGGPRIPFAEGITPSDGTVGALKRAETARRSRGALRALSVFGAVGVGFSALLFLVLAGFGSFAWAFILGGIVGIPSLLLPVLGASRSKARTLEMKRLLDEAWSHAAGDARAAGKASTTSELAQALGVSVARAEELQAIETVDASLEIGTPTANVPHDPRFDALEQKIRIADDSRAASAAAQAEEEAAEAAQATEASLQVKR